MKRRPWFVGKIKWLSSSLISLNLLVFLSVWISPAYADLPYCDEVFVNGIQTFGKNSYVHFDYNARIYKESTNEIKTHHVQNHPWSIHKSCSVDDCFATEQVLPKPRDKRKQRTQSTIEFSIPANKKMTVGADGVNQFGQVTVAQWATAEFSPQHDVYLIDRLHVGYKGTVRLPAGEYWVRDLRLEVESRIDVLGEGTVNLYVIDPLLVPLNVKLNAASRNPSRMTIYTYGSAEFYVGSQTYAFVRAESEIFMHHRARITGAVVARFVELRTESQIMYDAVAAKVLNFKKICKASDEQQPTDTAPPDIVDTLWDEEPDSNRASFSAIIRDTGDNASGIGSVVLKALREDIPLVANGDTYSADLTLVPGENYFTLVAYDQAGNYSTLDVRMYFMPTTELVNINYPVNTEQPFVVITGEVHSYWGEGDLMLMVGSEPAALIPVEDGLYRFEVTYYLPGWYNRFDISLDSPNGYLEHRATVTYHPAEIYVELDQQDVRTDEESITLTGTFGIPGSQHNIEWHGLVLIADHLPSELPVSITEVTEDQGRFSVEAPLAPGDNYFIVRVINTPGEIPWESGISIFRTSGFE